MAVQAQYSSEAFSHDFRGRNQSNMLEDVGKLYGHHRHHQIAGVFSGAQSELTCNNNASPSKKRRREDSSPIPSSTHCNQLQYPPPAISAEFSRVFDSIEASTSGRLPAPSPLVSPLINQELISQIHNQSFEVDTLVRLQNESLRVGLEEMRNRHRRDLASAMLQRVSKHVRGKEVELQIARQRNAELEERVRQLSAENEMWFNAAKESEAVVCSLRACLNQALLQSAAVPEGFGDSEGDDAQSCCFEAENRPLKIAGASTDGLQRLSCRVCRKGEASVLLLPCRHLCLCTDCEPKIAACPVCHAGKKANVQAITTV